MTNYQKQQDRSNKIKNLALMIYKGVMFLLLASAIMAVIWLAAWGGCSLEKVCRETNTYQE